MPTRRIQVGEAIVSVLNLGDLRFRLRDVERLPEGEWESRYGELFEKRLLFPSQSVHIRIHEASILVDAGDLAQFLSVDPSYAPEDNPSLPTLVEQLAEIGVQREDVTHCVITHAHYDHFAGVTTRVGGAHYPTFPRARCLLGRGDWENPEMRKALAVMHSTESLTLGVIERAGLLELVNDEERLTPAATVVPAPGESPGHQILRVQSGGETLYCLGDLFHHAVEVEDIRLMASWCDALANTKSRQKLVGAALDEDALLIAAHMPPGRLTGSAESPRFLPV